jgi:hypothetical protein
MSCRHGAKLREGCRRRWAPLIARRLLTFVWLSACPFVPKVNWEVGVYEAAGLAVGPGATALAFLPSDLNRFLVGLSSGVVAHGSRFGDTRAAHGFAREEVAVGAVTAVSFSPFAMGHFLVGYADGVVALFVESYGAPLLQWDLALALPPGPKGVDPLLANVVRLGLVCGSVLADASGHWMITEPDDLHPADARMVL